MSDYFEAEVYPLIGSEEPYRGKKKLPPKRNGVYSYEIRIINTKTNTAVYVTTAEGNNQKDAIANFRRNEAAIREKYLNTGYHMIGIKRI
jgi:hypothetical protein